MSETKQKIQNDLKDSMKSGEKNKVKILRTVMAAIKQFEVDSRTEIEESKVIDILQKEIKMRRDSLDFAIKENRNDLIEQNENEISLITTYLGEQLSEEELTLKIKELISSGKNSIGPIMGELNKNYKGKFEGKKASELIKNLLA